MAQDIHFKNERAFFNWVVERTEYNHPRKALAIFNLSCDHEAFLVIDGTVEEMPRRMICSHGCGDRAAVVDFIDWVEPDDPRIPVRVRIPDPDAEPDPLADYRPAVVDYHGPPTTCFRCKEAWPESAIHDGICPTCGGEPEKDHRDHEFRIVGIGGIPLRPLRKRRRYLVPRWR